MVLGFSLSQRRTLSEFCAYPYRWATDCWLRSYNDRAHSPQNFKLTHYRNSRSLDTRYCAPFAFSSAATSRAPRCRCRRRGVSGLEVLWAWLLQLHVSADFAFVGMAVWGRLHGRIIRLVAGSTSKKPPNSYRGGQRHSHTENSDQHPLHGRTLSLGRKTSNLGGLKL